MLLLGVLFSEEAGGGHSESPEIGWLVWVVLAVFAVMVFLGWYVSSKGLLKKEPELVQAHDDHGHGHPAHEDDHGHAKEDALADLEGIGPKVESVLKAAGIKTFADLAKADKAKVEEVLKAAGLRMMDPAGWIEQAELAAKGDTAGLKKLQDQLKGGRHV
jgi:predicted flap endonuclease-1-like 5' DNA nuclease